MKLSTLRTQPEHLEIIHARAIDGDTIQADIRLPLGVTLNRIIRLKGFFAPEHHGANPTMADAARQRLQDALDTHTCHIQCYGMRNDRYGRLTATLLLNSRPVLAGAVLGSLQLTPEAHRADLAIAKGGAAGGPPLST